jgi:predicted O-methyltransferase YrrM
MPKSTATHRTTVDIEVEAYQKARSVLGTRGYKDTINEALRTVDRAARLRHGAAAIRAGDLNLVTPEVLEELRGRRA